MFGWLIELFAEHAAREDLFDDHDALCPHCFHEIPMEEAKCRWCHVAIESSDSISWRTGQNERCEHRYGTFDVTAAKVVIASKRRPIMTIDFRFALAPPSTEDTSLDVPIICGGFAGDVLIIDGYKRFAEAQAQRCTAIRAVFLTERETNRIRIG